MGYTSQDDSITGTGDTENLIASICFDMMNKYFSSSFVLSLRPNTHLPVIYTHYVTLRQGGYLPSRWGKCHIPKKEHSTYSVMTDNLDLTKCWATLLLAPSCRDESLGLPTQSSHFGGHLMVAGSSQVHTSPWLLGVMLNASFISFRGCLHRPGPRHSLPFLLTPERGSVSLPGLRSTQPNDCPVDPSGFSGGPLFLRFQVATSLRSL